MTLHPNDLQIVYEMLNDIAEWADDKACEMHKYQTLAMGEFTFDEMVRRCRDAILYKVEEINEDYRRGAG